MMVRLRSIWFATLLAATLSLPAVAFAQAGGNAPSPIEVEDFRGKRLVFSKPAERIVCLLDSALTGLYMLGAENKVVGVSSNAYTGSSSRFYAAMDPRIRNQSLPVASSSTAGSLERILALKPDVVIVFSLSKEVVMALEERGIPVFGVFIEKLDDVYREVLALGKITGTTDRATELVQFSRREIGLIKDRVSTIPEESRPATYFMWAKGELDSGGSRSIVQELLDIAGGVNVCGHIDQEHVVMSLENLLEANPRLIVMWYNEILDPRDILAKPGWKVMSAARTGRIREMPDLFSCDLWTLNFQYSARLMAAWCHPELFGDTDLEQEAERIFQTLYGDRFPSRLLSFGPDRQESDS